MLQASPFDSLKLPNPEPWLEDYSFNDDHLATGLGSLDAMQVLMFESFQDDQMTAWPHGRCTEKDRRYRRLVILNHERRLQDFEQALTDCKRLSARAQSLIDDYRSQPK